MENFNVEGLKRRFTEAESSFLIRKDRKNNLVAEKDSLTNQLNELSIDNLNKAIVVLKKLSEKQRFLAKQRLEELGTQALNFSMGPNYELKIEFSDTRKRGQAYVYVYNKETGVKTSPVDENGGGIVDIVSIALQIVMLQATAPSIDGPIILDEPFKMVSEEYIPAMSEFLKKIGKDFDRQIIVITHNNYIAENCETKITI